MTKIVVHTFTMGDVEDPGIFVGAYIHDWQKTDAGKWVMENALEQPYWQQSISADTWGYVFAIIAKLSDENVTYYNLKWGNK